MVEELLKYAALPENSAIEVEQISSDGLRIKVPVYGWEATDTMITIYSLFWIVAFLFGIYISFFWYDLWYLQIVAVGVGLGLIYWIASEVNAFHEQQTIEVTPQWISIDKKRLFRPSSVRIPMQRVFEINLEVYPMIKFFGPSRKENWLFMEYSSEEEQVWVVKLLKIYTYKYCHRKV